MKSLHIAPGLSLPLDAATEALGIMAKRGGGKTYTASVIAEEMLKAGLVIGVLDPMGVMWGLRASADGRGPGLPILIAGGRHGDVPLEPSAGAVMADFLVEYRQSVILDMSGWRKAATKTFVTAFAERLFERNREPLHLFLDEADMFAPQRPQQGEEPMLGAVEDLVRRGRSKGIGITLITQRTAVLNKDVLTQVECLIALRTTGPQDIDAIDAWVKRHATPEQRTAFLNSLAGLPIGTAYFWSPGWLEIFKKVQVRARETFDSSATPKVGHKAKAPKRMAEVDIKVLASRIAATIEHAKQNDPAELKRRIVQLQGEVAKLKAIPAQVKQVEVPTLTQAERDLLEGAGEEMAASGRRWDQASETMRAIAGDLAETADRCAKVAERLAARAAAPAAARPTMAGSAGLTVVRHSDPGSPLAGFRVSSSPDANLRAGERRMLTILADRHPMILTRSQLGLLAGFTPRGGTFNGYLGRLIRDGLVSKNANTLEATELGRSVAAGFSERGRYAEPVDPLHQWLSRLRKGEREMLQELINAYPVGLDRMTLAENIGMKYTGGTFNGYLGTLIRNDLVEQQAASGGRGDKTLFANATLLGIGG